MKYKIMIVVPVLQIVKIVLLKVSLIKKYNKVEIFIYSKLKKIQFYLIIKL